MSDSSPRHLLIDGLGLIGGSIARAARVASPDIAITGIVRDISRYTSAVEAGVVDAVVLSSADCEQSVDLAIACTPVDRIVPGLEAIAAAHPDATLTDAGSAKQQIADAADASTELSRFVPAHPLAGSERTGWESGTASLLSGAACVICPRDGNSDDDSAAVERFWQSLGMRTLRMSAAEHDAQLAQTSHLPHLTASLLTLATRDADVRMIASGFRDTTRVAAGDAGLWTAIIEQNRTEVLSGLGSLRDELDTLAEHVRSNDWETVQSMLQEAAERRRSID